MSNIAKVIVDYGLEGLHRYYSVYRGQVVQNKDAENLNRLKVFVPGVQGGIQLWALPRHQHGSKNTGFKYLAPKIGDWVWVTFEQGAATHPLWEYHSWAPGETPIALRDPNTVGMVLPCGFNFLINDETGTMDIYITGEWNTFAGKPIRIVSDQSVEVVSRSSGIKVISNGTKEVGEVQVIANNSNVHISAPSESGKVIINDGANSGIVNINQLTEKINQLVQELETLRSTFNSHFHPHPMGPTSPTSSLVSKAFTQFKKEDYEDPKCIH